MAATTADGCSARICSTEAMSFHWATTTSANAAGGIPGVAGHGRGAVGRAGPAGVEAGAGEHAVEPAVIVALELDDEVATGHDPRQADGGGDGLAPGGREDRLVCSGDCLDQELGQLRLEAVLRSEGEPPLELGREGVADDTGAWPRMSGP